MRKFGEEINPTSAKETMRMTSPKDIISQKRRAVTLENRPDDVTSVDTSTPVTRWADRAKADLNKPRDTKYSVSPDRY